MGIVYNGTNDDGGNAGHPANSYGPNPPQTAITMVVLPGDAGSTYVPAGSFTYYNNDFSVIGNPRNDTQINNYIRAGLARGIDLSVTPPTNYVLNGDPSDWTKWSECASNDAPNDRRFVLSSNDFPLNAGTSAHIVLAHLVADSAGGCPSTSFNKMRIVADTAWHRYHSLATPEIKETARVNIYPNPAHDKLYIDMAALSSATDIAVYNMLGQKQEIGVSRHGVKYELAVGQLSPGLYLLRCTADGAQQIARFVKQ